MNIIHDSVNRQFYAEIGSYRAVLLYARQEKTMDMYHIYVPEPFRAEGAAARLLVAAFEFASSCGLEVVATCPFIAGDFLSRFPNYSFMVRPGRFVFAAAEH